MIWLQRFTETLVVAAMNKGCHCFSTALTKSRESKGCLKFVLGKHCRILSNYVKVLWERFWIRRRQRKTRTNVKFIPRWSWVRIILIIEWEYRERLKERICRELFERLERVFWEVIESVWEITESFWEIRESILRM